MTTVFVTPDHDTSLVNSPVVSIDHRSTKDNIITSSLELIDSQSSRIDSLEQQQLILAGVAALVIIWSLLF